jgi:hypothetical protein
MTINRNSGLDDRLVSLLAVCEIDSCYVCIRRIMRLEKTSRILTYFILGLNVQNKYGLRHPLAVDFALPQFVPQF